MRAFLDEYPDSEAAPEVRRYLASLESGETMAAEAPAPEELKPPDFDLPEEIFVPAFAIGSPGKRTSGYLRQLTGAVEAYREDHGRYPASLADLVRDGAYLAGLPADPFGGPFRYRSDGKTYWILAGKGPDGEEDPSVERFRGDPQTVAAALYREPEDEDAEPPAKGDIIAYRSLTGSRTGIGGDPDER